MIGDCYGVPASLVATALQAFDQKLKASLDALDSMIKQDQGPITDQVSTILTLMAWVHCEWARIHPFANGNGRIARLWANAIAMRYVTVRCARSDAFGVRVIMSTIDSGHLGALYGGQEGRLL